MDLSSMCSSFNLVMLVECQRRRPRLLRITWQLDGLKMLLVAGTSNVRFLFSDQKMGMPLDKQNCISFDILIINETRRQKGSCCEMER